MSVEGTAHVRVEAGDLFVGVFCSVDPRDRGLGGEKVRVMLGSD